MSCKNMKGGAVRMPSEYFGLASNRYYPAGSEELKSKCGQRAVSQGVIFPDGTAGPILRSQVGGKHHKTNKKSMKKHKSSKKNSHRVNHKKGKMGKMMNRLKKLSKKLTKKMKW